MIKSYDEQILHAIDTEADMEKEIFERSEFEKSASELIVSINMWLKSHHNEVMSDGSVPYPIQNSNLQRKFHLFLAILCNFSHFGRFLIVQSIRIPVLVQLINFFTLTPFSPEKQKMHLIV